MQLNDLKRKTKNPKRKDVGRGGKRGKTSGRGAKGQGQHGSHGLRPQMRDIIKKFPKLRGHGKNRARTVNSGVVKPVSVNLSMIDASFENGAIVSPKEFVKKGILSLVKGKNPEVKILSTGEITKKVKVVDCFVSETAKEKITKAGGTIKSK
jgi:large subunit ribosomal protein L15